MYGYKVEFGTRSHIEIFNYATKKLTLVDIIVYNQCPFMEY